MLCFFFLLYCFISLLSVFILPAMLNFKLIYDFLICRAVFLAVTGGIYSASLSMESSIIGFPLNYNLTFVLYGACFLVISFLTACLPDSVNRKKI